MTKGFLLALLDGDCVEVGVRLDFRDWGEDGISVGALLGDRDGTSVGTVFGKVAGHRGWHE